MDIPCMEGFGKDAGTGFEVRPLVTFKDKAYGLIRRRGAPPSDGRPVCLAPCSSIHTFFMEEKIDVAFATREGRIVRVERCLPPRRFVICAASVMAIERLACDGPWFEEGDEIAVFMLARRNRAAGKGKEEAADEALPGVPEPGVR